MSESTILADLKGRKFPVLDGGHVILQDVMGSDADIAAAARTSYGKGTRKTSEDRDLIRYLMRHKHSTPFEMAELKFHLRIPMDAMRQLVRHRTASINEYSTRYSEAIEDMQATPSDGWRLQATTNKQGSAGGLTEWPKGYRVDPFYWVTDEGGDVEQDEGGYSIVKTDPATGDVIGWRNSRTEPTPGSFLSEAEAEFQESARRIYRQRLAFGVAREQARKDLPLSNYTELVWKADLRNILGACDLRMWGHAIESADAAQWEIQEYFRVIGREIVAKLFPDTWAAFEDYILGAVTLTRLEIDLIRSILADSVRIPYLSAAAMSEYQPDDWRSRPRCRERDEAIAKLVRLGVLAGE